MISIKNSAGGKQQSVIRDQFEYGTARAKVVGWENISNLCIGNPSVPPPESVKEAMIDLLNNYDPVKLHGYTATAGLEEVRETLAQGMNERYGTHFTAKNLYLTVGAATALNVAFRALTNPGDEVIVIAPYFPEYKFYLEAIDCVTVEVPPRTVDFQIDMEALENAITPLTKAVLVNSPNNPSGAVYSEETIKKLSELLLRKSEEYGHAIYIISDDPYKELVYDGVQVPFIPLYYRNTVVCYSFSKCLSLPGERIGYLTVPTEVDEYEEIMAAVWGAARVLGFVNAPTIFQLTIQKCYNDLSNVSIYEKNRNRLYAALKEFGYDVVKPDGAFYIFPKSPIEDANEFAMAARKYDLLIVPGDDFGCPGYFRASYCILEEELERAIPLFKKLAIDFGLMKE